MEMLRNVKLRLAALLLPLPALELAREKGFNNHFNYTIYFMARTVSIHRH
jgi:hypothetical protein